MKTIPQSGLRRRILEAMHRRNEAMTIVQINQIFSTFPRRTVYEAVITNMDKGLVDRVGTTYILSASSHSFFEQIAQPKAPYVGEAAAPRTFISTRPLKSLPWAQHVDRLREISFIGLAGSGA